MIAFFPGPYPDELFYSICARFKSAMGYSYLTTAKVLFGDKHPTAIVELPCHLGHFVQQCPPRWGFTPNLIIDKYTMFPYYQPFLQTERVKQIRQQMITGSGKGIHWRVGSFRDLMSSSVLRYCPACVISERAVLGECYWHRLHQAPGVMVCLDHDVFLEESKVPLSTTLRFGLFSAEENILQVMPRSARDSPFFPIYHNLALSIAKVFESKHCSPDQSFWYEQYTALMMRNGFITPWSKVRLTEFLQAFHQFYPLELLNQVGYPSNLKRMQWKLWWRGMRGAKFQVPPLIHLLVLHMLGSKVTTFFHHRYQMPTVFGSGPWPCLNPVCANYRQPVIGACQISEPFGPRLPVGQFACTCGFIYSRHGPEQQPDEKYNLARIIAYGKVWEKQLRAWWPDLSLSVEKMGQKLGVSASTVYSQAKRLGLSVPRLPQKGRPKGSQPPPDKIVFAYRQRWLAFLKAHSAATRTQLYRLFPKDSKWLRRHDLEWFMEHLPVSKRSLGRPCENVFPNQSDRVGLKVRHLEHNDAKFADQARIAAQQLIESPALPKRISIRGLQRVAPSLIAINYRRDKFPLTIKVIEEYQETSKELALRKISWAFQSYQEERICPTRKGFIKRARIGSVQAIPQIRQAVEGTMSELSKLFGDVR